MDKGRNFRYQILDKFIFIHINKTGGSSIEKALNLPLEHKTALEKLEEIGQENWQSNYSFTIVRNPWDKVVSHYHYRVQTNQTNLAVRPIDFREWVRLTYGIQDPYYYDFPKMFMPQLDWISDNNGRILVDHICRFENLRKDFKYGCERLGRTVTLTHVKASPHGNYQDYYDQGTIELVASWFIRDIQSLGYVF